MFGLSPQSLAIKAGVLVGVAVLAFAAGWRINGWRHDAAQLAAVNAAIETYKHDQLKLHQLAAKSVERIQEKERVVYQPIYRTLTKVVERPVYRECAIDDDGLRLLNSAIAGQADAGRGADGSVRASGGPGR